MYVRLLTKRREVKVPVANSLDSKFFCLCIFAMFLCVLVGCGRDEDPLTPEERAWLDAHDRKIVLAGESGWPPISFLDENGRFAGINADYCRLIEQRLGFRFKIEKVGSFQKILDKAQAGQVDVIMGLMPTPKRSQFLSFTEAYFEISSVILTRRDRAGPLTCDDLAGERVAVAEGFVYVDYFKDNYPELKLIPVATTVEGISRLSAGEFDAMVAELPTSSYIIEKEGLTNLRVAGFAGQKVHLAIGCRKDSPHLQSILSKGLALISDRERVAIHRKWIGLRQEVQRPTILSVLLPFAACLFAVVLIVVAWRSKRKRRLRRAAAEGEVPIGKLRAVVIKRKNLRVSLAVACILVLASLVLIVTIRRPPEDLLTPRERAWLREHEGQLVVAPDPHAPPIDFFDEEGNWKGIGAEMFMLVEKKLDIRFKVRRLDSWSQVMEKIRTGEVSAVSAVTKTPLRSEFMVFTEPYAITPAVIVTRKEYKGKLKLEDMRAMRIAVTKDYSLHEYVRTRYDYLDLVPVTDELTGLRMTSFGQVDAMLVYMADASYLVRKDGITNLRIAGETEYFSKLSIGIRNDRPILRDILSKGLAQITQKERDDIYRKWVHLGRIPFYQKRSFWLAASGVSAVVFAIVLITLAHSIGLRRMVAQRTTELSKELHERELAEEALGEANRKLLTLMGNLPGIAYRSANDRDWTFSFVSEGCAELTGYPPEDLIGSRRVSYHNVIHPDDRQPVWDQVQAAVKEKRPFILEYRIRTSSGEEKWVWEKGQGVFSPEGELLALEGFIVDTTERRKAEEELRNLRNYLRNIIDSMPSVLIGVDAEGRVTQWNRLAQRETGIDATSALGRKLEEVFPRLAVEMEKIHKAMAERQTQQDLKRPHQKEGVTHFEDVTVYPLVANGIEGAVIRLDDATERVRIEEIMVQSEKMLSIGGLAAGMAHEINNPLAGILQNVQVIRNRITGDMPKNTRTAEECGTTMEALRSYLERREVLSMIDSVANSGQRAAQIVSNVLSFSRKAEMKPTPNDIGELLDKTVELALSDYDLRKKYDFRKIEIVRQYDAGIPKVPCEASKIQQVFLNVLKNGAEAMAGNEDQKEEPRFTFRTRRQGDMVRVEIQDNGPGMSETVRKRVFEPFFTTKGVTAGTGLGLSVSYFIITKDHGGTMSVESEPGFGSTFVVCLPLKGAEQ